MGLLDAVETYDPGRRTKFESYAISKIRWSILDELRKVDPLSRRVRLRMRETELARNELAQKLGRAPSEPEVHTTSGWRSGSTALLERCARAQVGSLEARLECERGLSREMRDLVPTTRRPGVGRGGGGGSGAAGAGHGSAQRAGAGCYNVLLLRGTDPARDRAPLSLPRGISPRSSGRPPCVSAGR